MNEDEDKPNPDELLKAIQKEEELKSLGQLRIFFGMAAGVGKTYAMLEAAQQKLKEGARVVIGVINTHGRKETEALLQGIPLIPEKWVKYKETVFEEMDLETILQSHPDLVLVDELAHTNVPGSKHPKRWQDVIEILDAGIDVYTTLNVQHVESRKDLVESLTGIQVRETVPDLVLERASSIELIDLPAPDLLRRLKEGKVYLGDQSKRAAENFFKEENLMALREIALRFTAEKVDHDLHGILQGKGWKTRERLMVAITPSPSSEGLIRAARRLAFELDAPWIAVYVDMGKTLSDQDQIRLNRYLNLARELGAEVITTHDLDVAAALQRIAGQRDITRIVIGRPPAKKGFFANLFHSSFIDRLENENKQVDLVILRQDKLTHIYQRSFSQIYQFSGSLKAYGLVFAFGAVSTLIGLAVSPLIGYKLVGFIFLFNLLILSFLVGRGPIFLAAILSAICWDLLFIPPIFTPWIFDTEDAALLVSYFLIAAVLGTITSRMREQERFLSKREETMERLYEIEREIANATNVQYLRLNVASHLEHHFPGKFDILIKSPDNQLIFDSQLPPLNTEKEKVTAIWVFQNGKMGGWSTDTLPSSAGMYFPIKFFKATVGVLVYFPSKERPLSTDEINFLQTVAQQLGIYLERSIFEERVRRQDYSRQIERMHRSIFHSLNRSFYIPLEGILKINQQIQQESADSHIRLLASQMEQFIFNFKLSIDNVIAVSELESGFVHFERKPNSIKELIDKSLSDVKSFMDGHPIELQIPSQTLFLPFDFNLLRLALKNLILNAFEYSASSAPVCIKLKVGENNFSLSVLDEGPGIPEDILPLIFTKFYQASETSRGLGLGLAIVKAVADIHQGKIEAKNREIRGTEISLILPLS